MCATLKDNCSKLNEGKKVKREDGDEENRKMEKRKKNNIKNKKKYNNLCANLKQFTKVNNC